MISKIIGAVWRWYHCLRCNWPVPDGQECSQCYNK